MNNQKRMPKPFQVDRTAPRSSSTHPSHSKTTQVLQPPNGEMIVRTDEYETTLEDAETRQVPAAAAKSFNAAIEFYNNEIGGSKTHADAVKETLQMPRAARGYLEGLAVERNKLGTPRGGC